MDTQVALLDKDGWEVFYKNHCPWLLRLLKIKSGDPFLAEDITHDTFIKIMCEAHLHLLKDSPLNKPRAFLRTVANNLLIDKVRHELVEQSYIHFLEISTSDYAHISAEKHVEIIQELTHLSQALSQLPVLNQQTFLLYYIDGLTYQEIAQKLSISMSTVRRYIAGCMLICYQMYYEYE